MLKTIIKWLFIFGLAFHLWCEFTNPKPVIKSGPFDNKSSQVEQSTVADDSGEDSTPDRVQIENTTASPYNAVCYVVAYYANGSTSQGSGVLISSNQVLTAGHVIYSEEDGGFPEIVEITPGKNGPESPYGSSYSTNITAPRGWTDYEDHNWDFAVVETTDSFSQYLPYRVYGNYNSSVGISVTNIGYPADMSGYMCSDTEFSEGANDNQLKLDNEIQHGDSGGPVLDEGNHVIGIISHIRTSADGNVENIAVRINQEVFDWLNDYLTSCGKTVNITEGS